MSNAPTTTQPGTVASEAARIRPLLRKLEEVNQEMILDLVDNLPDSELAERYTSGDMALLHRRLSYVLMTRLGLSKSLVFDEMRMILKEALADERKSA